MQCKVSYQVRINRFSMTRSLCPDLFYLVDCYTIVIQLDDVAGIARGCGWQHLAVYVNLATFYVIGVPIGCVLGFKSKLQAKVSLYQLNLSTFTCKVSYFLQSNLRRYHIYLTEKENFLQGLWIGLICGLFCQASTLLFITLRTKWAKLNLPVEGNKENRVSV
jgi:MATE family multidrug resistance protein